MLLAQLRKNIVSTVNSPFEETDFGLKTDLEV